MGNKSVNYVIAAWSGLRRGKPRPTRNYKKYFEDRTYFLRFHLDFALKKQKNISHVTIVAPFNSEEEPKEFARYLADMPAEINGIEVTVLRRENVGVSFGSFSFAFEKLGAEWDYYIFNEDDHIPIAKDFDEKLITALEDAGPQCGCMCTWLRRDKHYKKNPVIGHLFSVAKSSVLSNVAKVNEGKLPYKLDVYSGLSADEFSHGFTKARYKISDMTDKYCAAYVKGDGRIWWVGGDRPSEYKVKGKEALIVPIEMWENHNREQREKAGM